MSFIGVVIHARGDVLLPFVNYPCLGRLVNQEKFTVPLFKFSPIWQLIKAAYTQIVIYDENDWLMPVKVHTRMCQHLSQSSRKIDFFLP